MRIETPAFLPEDMVEDFLKIYRAAFEPLDVLAAARQSLTDDEFVEEMGDPSVLKWVAWDDFDRPCGMAFVATDLTKVPWISVPYFQARFPEHFERRAIYYWGALLMHPDHQGTGVVRELLGAVMRRTAADNAICAFDCCAFNVDVKHVPDFAAEVAKAVSVHVGVEEIDVQRYYAYDLKGEKK